MTQQLLKIIDLKMEIERLQNKVFARIANIPVVNSREFYQNYDNETAKLETEIRDKIMELSILSVKENNA